MNDFGDVVGSSASPEGFLHAFVWTGGTMQDLGTLGGSSSSAYGINSSGDIVGCSYIPEAQNSHAFLWKGGGLLDLNSLIPKDSGWELNEAYAINENGQIVGDGTYRGQTRAFRLDPQLIAVAAGIFTDVASVPESSTLSMLALGALLIAFRKFRF